MVNTNQRHLHLTPIEEADALFAASQAGASKTRIRKATGLGKDHVSAALAAGRLSDETRLKTEACYGLNLEQYALLLEFEDDPTTVDRLLEAFNRASPASTLPNGSAPNVPPKPNASRSSPATARTVTRSPTASRRT